MGDSNNQLIGHAQDAANWVKASLLPNSIKESWLKFIQKFPDLEYYKLKDATASEEPAWLQVMSATLRGFVPQGLLWVQLDQFAQSNSSDLTLNKIWYHRMFTTEISSEYERILLGEHELLILYSWLETLGSILAVKVEDEIDERIYEFSYNDITSRNESEGHVPSAAAHVAFNSYAEMLDHIVAIKLESGEIIQALGNYSSDSA